MPTKPQNHTNFIHRRPFHVFLSYVRADDQQHGGGLTDWVSQLIHAIKTEMEEPIHLFVDKEGIEAGSNFPEAIKFHIQRADIFIAILSKNYPASLWCPRELDLFVRSSKQRGLTARNLLLVELDGQGKAALKNLAASLKLPELNSIQIAAEIGTQGTGSLATAVKAMTEMLHPLPPKRTRGFSIDDTSRSDWRRQEVYQYVSAFDSVRSQRDKDGMPQQGVMIDLRAKLSYLLGYTIVVSETQAFDSLGAIHTVAEAARAWRAQPGPIAPFRIAYFRKPKGHVVDIALNKFDEVEKGTIFDFSAWRRHESQRDGGQGIITRLDEAKVFAADWNHFLDAAGFLSWFPCDRIAEIAPVSSDVYLHHLIETYSGRSTPDNASSITDGIRTVLKECNSSGLRTKLYQAADRMKTHPMNWTDAQVEAVKDVVDVVYNRTVADSLLLAATSNRQARSICLTDPTPDRRAQGFDEVVQSLLSYGDVSKAESHGYAQFEGAWEDRHDSAPATGLNWSEIFEITSLKEWLDLRDDVLSGRGLDATPGQWQDSMLALATWLGRQLPGNVVVDAQRGRIMLRAHGFEAGIGSRLEEDAGIIGQGK
jgi:hypothetical protein